ncbi:hypothetical protein CCACVL1_28775 [Corchorus capsularis]|uniref:DUF8040 domain-containing protein n=1 Tax=Corchorus capsularis TaxID=210143 RepID=A0A1R3G593_COCAP|nr:hypothetical protein CCACVL1_28775 [Corchorus capsularis]
MFLVTLNHNVRNRVTKRRFNHSTQTVHFYFAKEMIVPTPSTGDTVNTQHRRLREIFKGPPAHQRLNVARPGWIQWQQVLRRNGLMRKIASK